MYGQESNEQYSRLATFMEAEEVMEREELKRLAGYRAAEYVVDGTVVGLGTARQRPIPSRPWVHGLFLDMDPIVLVAGRQGVVERAPCFGGHGTLRP